MSEENVELAQRYFEVFNTRGLDGAVQFWHPEIELYDPSQFPDADRYVGVAAVRERVEGYIEVGGWDGRFRDQEFLDAGDEVLVISQLSGGSPRFGGTIPPEFNVTVAQIFLFEGGKVRRCRQYLSRAEGLDAAGLEE